MEGKVAHLGYQVGDMAITYKVGDHVLFKENNEFKNTIEGKEYYVMYQKEIFATKNGEDITPTFNYVFIEDKNRKDREKVNGIYVGGKNRKDNGRVVSVGSSCIELSDNDIVKFNMGALTTWN